MGQPFFAMIIPVGDGRPDQGLPPAGPGQPPGIWPGPGVPTPPIYNPPGVWPQPPGGGGGQPPGIWPSPGWPSHPIAPGGRPPGPSQGPGFPTPPIFLPPGTAVPPPQINIPVFPSQLPMPGGPGEGGSGGTPGWPSMPGTGPSHPISGGYILVYHPSYGWILVAPGGGPSSPGSPDQGLPGAQPGVDNTLPGAQPGPDQGLPSTPPSAQPKGEGRR